MAEYRYAIRFQYRRPGGCKPGANPQDWRSWRLKGVWPILFDTWDEAAYHAVTCNVFANLEDSGRKKPSITISRVKIKEPQE